MHTLVFLVFFSFGHTWMSIHTQHFDVCRHRHVHTKLTFSLGFVLAPGGILPPMVQHVQSGSSRASARFQGCFFVWPSGKVMFNKGKIKKRHAVRCSWDLLVYYFSYKIGAWKTVFHFPSPACREDLWETKLPFLVLFLCRPTYCFNIFLHSSLWVKLNS